MCVTPLYLLPSGFVAWLSPEQALYTLACICLFADLVTTKLTTVATWAILQRFVIGIYSSLEFPLLVVRSHICCLVLLVPIFRIGIFRTSANHVDHLLHLRVLFILNACKIAKGLFVMT